MTDVVVLLGTRMAELEAHGTRWRAVLTRWAVDPRVRSLTVVDFPRFGPRPVVRETGCWLPGCRALDLQVPGRVAASPFDPLGWWLAGRAVSRALPPSDDRLVVATTPLSAPLLHRVPARRRAFDAVDDWRALPSMQAARGRVVAGYRAAARADVSTSVSAVLTERLRADFDLVATTVGNGVDPAPATDVPAGLPAGPFAVYAGNVQERVDLDLVAAAAGVVPVVVAGRAGDAQAERLRALPLTWLGPLPVGQVRGLLEAASVGLLPHHRDALTDSMAPMKLLEYAAAGLPVVSTSVAGLDGVPRVTVADGCEDFAREVAAASRAGRRPPPADWVAQHDWDRVSDQLLKAYA